MFAIDTNAEQTKNKEIRTAGQTPSQIEYILPPTIPRSPWQSSQRKESTMTSIDERQ
jgi:hypothetical protein